MIYVTIPQLAGSLDCIVISWNNMLNANGNRQTFQVVIEPVSLGWDYKAVYLQGRIWFQYKNITLGNIPTTVGVRDQTGVRGVSYNYSQLANERALVFYQTSNYAAIHSLTIELITVNDQYAYIDIIEDPEWMRGINVKLRPDPKPDPNARFALALAGGVVLLISPKAGAVGFILGAILWIPEMAEALAGLLPKAELEIMDYQPLSYAKAPAIAPEWFNRPPVDALFGISVFWVFTDPNTQNHELTIKAKLTYTEYNIYGTPITTKTIPTEVSLNVWMSAPGGGDPSAPILPESHNTNSFENQLQAREQFESEP